MTRTALLLAAAPALYIIARVLRKRARSAHDPAVSATMRLEVLSRRMLTGITNPTPDGVLGAAMDWNVGNGMATLVALVDGTVSLYVLPGSGTIGAGTHSTVAAAAERFLQASRQARAALHEVRDYPPPDPEHMVFYLLLRDRTLSSGGIPVSQLQVGTHQLSAVAGLAQALLTEVRKVSE